MPIPTGDGSTSTVSSDDVAVSLGRSLSDTEQAQVAMWIADAELQIRLRLGSLADLDQDALAYVVREAVVLKIKRPDPAQRVEIAVDDGRIARQYDKDTGQVTILPEWWEMLSPTAKSGAFSFQPYGSCSAHVPWCSLMLGATYCSCGTDIAGEPIYEVGGL